MPAQSWNDIGKTPVQPKKKLQGTCDEHCIHVHTAYGDQMGHSPGCKLRSMIDAGYLVSEAFDQLSREIETGVLDSQFDPYLVKPRVYNPATASEEETRKYKTAMRRLYDALYEFCDCGAKHDHAGHYSWCGTQVKGKGKK